MATLNEAWCRPYSLSTLYKWRREVERWLITNKLRGTNALQSEETTLQEIKNVIAWKLLEKKNSTCKHT